MKKSAKILTSIFLIIFIIQMVSIIVLFLLPQASSADEVQFTPQVEIPGMANNLNSAGNGSYTINENSIGNYIKTIYNYAIGIVGIVAAAVLMWGGVTWLTAGGSPDKVNNAKSWITASLTGLLLAFSSYFILATINSDLVNFKSINVPAPASSGDEGAQNITSTGGCCRLINNCTYVQSADDCNGATSSFYKNQNCNNIEECGQYNTECDGTAATEYVQSCGDEKICHHSACYDCEADLNGYCTIDVCCEGMCCSTDGIDHCITGTPTNGKYCE